MTRVADVRQFTQPTAGGELLSDRLAESFALHAQSTAIIHEDETLLYSTLQSRANCLARFLISMGVGPESIVPIALESSPDRIVAMLGILFAGGAYLPLDTEAPPLRLAKMVEGANASVVITSTTLKNRLELEGLARTVALDDSNTASMLASLSDLPLSAAERIAPLRPQNLAYVIYTSGSTGEPKGVGNTHAAICASLEWLTDELGIDATDRVVHRCDYTFDVSVWEIFSVLLAGGALIVPKAGEARDSAQVALLVRRHESTLLFIVPTMLIDLLGAAGAADCVSLRNIVALGEALSGALQKSTHATLPEVRLWNGYGPTEAAVCVTLWLCRRKDGTKGPPIGSPAPCTQIYLFDESLRLTPDGEPGEIFIAGDFLARGYLGRPELTAERFIPCPIEGGGPRMYRTGDLGERRADGELYFLGRNDSQVKFNGIRVELGEIEAAVGALPGVARAAVMARELAGENRLVAYVIMEPGAPDLMAREAKATLAHNLPRHLVPSFFVTMAEFPLTTSAKLNAKALPNPDLAGAKAAYRAPNGELEILVAGAFAHLFGLKKIGADDNFFDLGGTSLTAMRLASRIKAATGLALPMRALVERATPAGLAEVLGLLKVGDYHPTELPFASRPIVFALPGAGGSDLSLGAFELACDGTLDLRILDYPDWRELCAPDATFEGLARRLTDQIVAASPTGEIGLTGYSLGGEVAFEIARQLRARGRRVSFFGIIDTEARAAATGPSDLAGRLRGMWRKTARLIRDKEVTLAISTNFWRRTPSTLLPLAARLLAHGTDRWREYIEKRLRVTAMTKLLHAWSDKPSPAPPLDAPTFLFRVKPNLLDEGRFDGWWRRCQTIQTVYIDGHHLDILAPANLQSFVPTFLRAVVPTHPLDARGGAEMAA